LGKRSMGPLCFFSSPRSLTSTSPRSWIFLQMGFVFPAFSRYGFRFCFPSFSPQQDPGCSVPNFNRFRSLFSVVFHCSPSLDCLFLMFGFPFAVHPVSFTFLAWFYLLLPDRLLAPAKPMRFFLVFLHVVCPPPFSSHLFSFLGFERIFCFFFLRFSRRFSSGSSVSFLLRGASMHLLLLLFVFVVRALSCLCCWPRQPDHRILRSFTFSCTRFDWPHQRRTFLLRPFR